jgi:CDP-4-dehydro-6-deoxyglucose reductase, E1
MVDSKSITYPLAEDSWDEKERAAISRVVKSGKFTMGSAVEKFEKEFASFFGSRFAVFSNSGSSANLLAIAALIYSNKIKKGDEVIVPAVSWSTTYYPLQQYGLKLKFVDINLYTLNADFTTIKDAISRKTKAIFCVNLLGNPSELAELKDLCDKKNILLIEDNCESLGAKYNGKYTGTFGILGTFSTYYSHHISTIEGGVTLTDDELLYHTMISLRAHGWTRGLPENSKLYKVSSNSFYEQFNFILPGYNLRPTEIQGSIGLEQIKKIPKIIEQRRRNARYFKNSSSDFSDYITQSETGESSWFGFSIILTGLLTGKRDQLVKKLEVNGIECRPIVAGNFALNPVIKYLNYKIHKGLFNSNKIHKDGLFVGNHSVDNNGKIDLLIKVLKDFYAENI